MANPLARLWDWFTGKRRPAHAAPQGGPDPARTAKMRPYLSGQSPGFWASDHFEETQHYTGWTYCAVKSLATQAAQATVSATESATPVVKMPRKRRKELACLSRAQRERQRLLAAVRKERRRADRDAAEKAAGSNTDATAQRQARRPLPDTHPIVRLLKRPNVEQSGAAFRFQVVQQLALTGTALVWVLRNKLPSQDEGRGYPVELYVIPTGLARPQPPSAAFPRGAYRLIPLASWESAADDEGYQPMGALGQLLVQGAIIDARDVKPIRWPHPLFLSDGLSPLSAGVLFVDVAEQLERSRWYDFKQASKPGLVFSVDPTINPAPEDKAAFRVDLSNRHAGTANTGNDLILPPGVSAEQIVRSPAEMDYVNSQPQARDSVLALHGTPSVAIGVSEAGSYAAFFASLKQYVELSVQPMLNLIAEELTEVLSPAYGGTQEVKLAAKAIDDPDLALRQQANDVTKWQAAADKGACTVNEFRKGLGLGPPVPWGEKPMGQPEQPPPGAPPQPGQGQPPGAPPKPGTNGKPKPRPGDDVGQNGQQQREKPPANGAPSRNGTGQRDAVREGMPKQDGKALTNGHADGNGRLHKDNLAVPTVHPSCTVAPPATEPAPAPPAPPRRDWSDLDPAEKKALAAVVMQEMQEMEALRKSATFDESKHPRDDDGKFGSGGGGATEEKPKDKPADKPDKLAPTPPDKSDKPRTPHQKWEAEVERIDAAHDAAVEQWQAHCARIEAAHDKATIAAQSQRDALQAEHDKEAAAWQARQQDREQRSTGLESLHYQEIDQQAEGERIAALNAALSAPDISDSAEVRDRFAELADTLPDVYGGAFLSAYRDRSLGEANEAGLPDEARAKLAADVEKWAGVLAAKADRARTAGLAVVKAHEALEALGGDDGFDMETPEGEAAYEVWQTRFDKAESALEKVTERFDDTLGAMDAVWEKFAQKANDARDGAIDTALKAIATEEAEDTEPAEFEDTIEDPPEPEYPDEPERPDDPPEPDDEEGEDAADEPDEPDEPLPDSPAERKALRARLRKEAGLVSTKAGKFDESKHPRADDGKFGSGGGATTTEEKPKDNPTAKPDEAKPASAGGEDDGQPGDEPPDSGKPAKQSPEEAAADYKENGTKAKAFKEWFGESKVVDEDGEPLVVYHGTSADFEAFDTSAIKIDNLGKGFYFTDDPEIASSYADRRAGERKGAANVMPVYLSIKKPLDFRSISEDQARDFIGFYYSLYNKTPEEIAGFVEEEIADAGGNYAVLIQPGEKEARQWMQDRGYDGLIVPGKDKATGKEGVAYVAIKPNQIKSKHNQGTFDPDTDHIRKQHRPRPDAPTLPPEPQPAPPASTPPAPTVPLIKRRRVIRDPATGLIAEIIDSVEPAPTEVSAELPPDTPTTEES